MKKIISLILLLALLVGCSNSANPNDHINSDSNENIEEEQKKKSNVSISFSEIEVIARDKSLSIAGEARSNVNSFYYTLEQGDEVIIDETVVELDAGGVKAWRPFEINHQTFEIKEESDEAPYLKFYVKEDGEIINPNYVPIDLVFY